MSRTFPLLICLMLLYRSSYLFNLCIFLFIYLVFCVILNHMNHINRSIRISFSDVLFLRRNVLTINWN